MEITTISTKSRNWYWTNNTLLCNRSGWKGQERKRPFGKWSDLFLDSLSSAKCGGAEMLPPLSAFVKETLTRHYSDIGGRGDRGTGGVALGPANFSSRNWSSQSSFPCCNGGRLNSLREREREGEGEGTKREGWETVEQGERERRNF